MPLTSESAGFQQQLARLESIARDVAASNAADVDARSRFPQETIDALKAERLLAAPIPKDLGGGGCGVAELAELCSTLGKACGSSAMVLAMHYVQVACLVRHAGDSEPFRHYLRELAERQYLLASMTSETGTFGEMRTSLCAVQRDSGRFTLKKDATTGSYCSQADGILVTARRAPDAPETDQVLVLIKRSDCQLTQIGTWDAMGMRGTCSPAFRLESSGPEEQILPRPFVDIAAQTMVPYSHVLWASLWWGIAADAVARAATLVRNSARRNLETIPSNAMQLATAFAKLQGMHDSWIVVASELDALDAQGATNRRQLNTIGWAIRLNSLKVGASEAAPRIVHQALQVCGILGYKNDTLYSIGRHYRDVLSASLMVSNARISSKNASMLLIYKDD